MLHFVQSMLFLLVLSASLTAGDKYHINPDPPDFNLIVIRHVETHGNAIGKRSDENDRIITDKGKKQIKSITQLLEDLSVDAVLVSPTFRTRETVMPYLKKKNLKGEIWQELAEWEYQTSIGIKSDKNIVYSDTLRIEKNHQDYFIFHDTNDKYKPYVKNYDVGLELFFQTVREIKTKFQGSGKTIAIVTHKHQGSRLIEVFEGKNPEVQYKLLLGKGSVLSQNAKGKYKLLYLNEKPFKK